MKKRYILIGLLASCLSTQGQTGYSKKKLKKTDVQGILSYYTQDNNHSAVTGGIGTENLQVYAAQLSIDTGNDSTNTYHIDSGIDVISSASTDNIDYVVSSASKTDIRTHLNIGYGRHIRGTNFKYGLSAGGSVESDYLSKNLGASLNHVSEDLSRELSISFQTFFDDLRWGRFDNGHAQKLIYPVELRNRQWFTNYNRNSFNLSLGIYQVINRRMALGIYPGAMYQSGLLSTPFHRVYFNDKDNTKRVENLPDKRLKFPLGFQLNTFVGPRVILRSNYTFYRDNFGITAHAINLESPVKISYAFAVTMFARMYSQSQANYFNPYKEHRLDQEFYTSDYDLSRFTSIKTGLGIRFAPVAKEKITAFKEIEVRYAFYRRSDGMTAHTISMFFDFKRDKFKLTSGE